MATAPSTGIFPQNFFATGLSGQAPKSVLGKVTLHFRQIICSCCNKGIWHATQILGNNKSPTSRKTLHVFMGKSYLLSCMTTDTIVQTLSIKTLITEYGILSARISKRSRKYTCGYLFSANNRKPVFHAAKTFVVSGKTRLHTSFKIEKNISIGMLMKNIIQQKCHSMLIFSKIS